jgi:hypothetical protein
MALPNLDKFKEVVKAKRGNLTRVAEAFGVDRRTVHNWANEDPEFKNVIDNARARLFDDALMTSELVALGVADKDEHGNFKGWIERPDSNMLRYLVSTLGRNEGFGEQTTIDLNANVKGSINIDDWIKDKAK